jgi:hypothetical protein
MNVPRFYASEGEGQKLPSFREWVIRQHGQELWKKQFEDVFESYVYDIFRECRPSNTT